MKLSGTQVLGIIKNYFSSNQSTAMETFWFLLFPGIILTIILLAYTLWPDKNNDINSIDYEDDEKDNSEINNVENDFDLIDSIRLQKGLEINDRDFLISVCSENKLDVVKVMLDKAILEKLENKIADKILFKGRNPEEDKTILYLRKLKKRLFF